MSASHISNATATSYGVWLNEPGHGVFVAYNVPLDYRAARPEPVPIRREPERRRHEPPFRTEQHRLIAQNL